MSKPLSLDHVRRLANALSPEEIGVLMLTTEALRSWPVNKAAARSLVEAGLLSEESGLYRANAHTYQAIACLLAKHDRIGV